jgi:uncharacterized membrane protein YjjP (DUF1212 family)
MTVVETLNQIADETAGESLNCNSAHARLAALERNTPIYQNWLIALMLGLSAASLSRLLGGDWSVFLVVYLAATIGTLVRQQLGRWHLNQVAVPFLAALVSGVIGGIGMRLHSSSTQYLSLLAPGMILIPGAPLINGIRYAISNNIGMACAKLTFVSFVILVIALGLFTATLITGVGIPVAGQRLFYRLRKTRFSRQWPRLDSYFCSMSDRGQPGPAFSVGYVATRFEHL